MDRLISSPAAEANYGATIFPHVESPTKVTTQQPQRVITTPNGTTFECNSTKSYPRETVSEANINNEFDATECCCNILDKLCAFLFCECFNPKKVNVEDKFIVESLSSFERRTQ